MAETKGSPGPSAKPSTRESGSPKRPQRPVVVPGLCGMRWPRQGGDPPLSSGPEPLQVKVGPPT